jgi:hypothetical protein
VAEKRCTKCGAVKGVEEFASYFNKKQGQHRYQSWCRACMSQHNREARQWDKDHPDEAKRLRKEAERLEKRRLRHVSASSPIIRRVIPPKYRSFLADEPSETCLWFDCNYKAIPSPTNIEGTNQMVYCCLCPSHWIEIEGATSEHNKHVLQKTFPRMRYDYLTNTVTLNE